MRKADTLLPPPWRTEPTSREYFKNILQRDCEIEKETLEEHELEVMEVYLCL